MTPAAVFEAWDLMRGLPPDVLRRLRLSLEVAGIRAQVRAALVAAPLGTRTRSGAAPLVSLSNDEQALAYCVWLARDRIVCDPPPRRAWVNEEGQVEIAPPTIH